MRTGAAAITGVGLMTPAGVGVDENWKRVVDGEPTAAEQPDLAGLPVRIACRVPEFSPKDLGLRRAYRWDRYTILALAAAREAVERAGYAPGGWADDTRVAVVIGSGVGGAATLESEHRTLLEEGPDEMSPSTLPMGLLNMAAGHVAIDLGTGGPCLAPCTACASGATAMGIATRMLRSDEADVVVVGAAEAPVTPFYAAAFARMGALSRRNDDPEHASRPFDVDRDGFVLGEGAAVMVVEREADARARGAEPVAMVAGYGASADAHHVTAPDPEGRGARRAMTTALADAGLTGDDVDHVNAHGTSTPLNDITEAGVIRSVVGSDVPVTSTKGVVGHALGGCGAIEIAYTALTLERGVVPPVAGLVTSQDGMDIDLVQGTARPSAPRVALSNSFGFGGQNATVALVR